MSSFSEFTNQTATMKRIETDGAGDPSVVDSFSVQCDPSFEFRRIVTRQNEEITARGPIIVNPDARINDHYPGHTNWQFEFEGVSYNVENMERVTQIGSLKPDHYSLHVR